MFQRISRVTVAAKIVFNSSTPAFERCGQLRDRIKKISHQAKVRDLKDRRLRILVDRDNRLGVSHSGQVLDRPREPDRHIDLWGDNFSGLPDLEFVRE